MLNTRSSHESRRWRVRDSRVREDRAQSAPERPVKQECTYGPPNNFDPGPPNNFDPGPPNNSRQSPEPTRHYYAFWLFGGGGGVY